MSELDSAARWWVEVWLRQAPQNAAFGAFTVILVTMLVIALFASVFRLVAFRKEISTRFRLHARVDDWHRRHESRVGDSPIGAIPADMITRWAKLEFRRAQAWTRARMAAESLGGWAFQGRRWPRLPAAVTPFTLLLAVGVTYAGWPDASERRSTGAGLVSRIGDVLQGFLGLPIAAVVLVIVALALIPRTPLVDHIRARDEAAKTANAQLAQLAGSMAALYYGASLWGAVVERNRSIYVREMVRNYTHGTRIWSGGVVSSPDTLRQSLSSRWCAQEPPQEFIDAYARVREQRLLLQQTGVEMVAWRLSGRALNSLKLAGIHWYGLPTDLDMRRVYHPPEEIEKFLTEFGPTAPWPVDSPPEPWREADLTRVAANAARVMDLFLVDIALAEFALYEATNFLTGRMVSRWWIRAFGAMQR